MAIALLGTPSSTAAVNVNTPYTAFTYTVSAGSDRLLCLAIGHGDSEQEAVTAVTYGGQSMTQVGTAIGDGTWTGVELYILKETGIAAATNTTFSVTIGGTGDFNHLMIGAFAFSGVEQGATTTGTPATDSGTSTAPSPGAVSSAVGEVVIAAMATDDDNAFAEGGTLLFESEGQANGNGDTGAGAQYYAGASPTVTPTWTTDSALWSAIGVSIRAASGGGSETITMDKWSNRSAELIARRITGMVASGTMSIKN